MTRGSDQGCVNTNIQSRVSVGKRVNAYIDMRALTYNKLTKQNTHSCTQTSGTTCVLGLSDFVIGDFTRALQSNNSAAAYNHMVTMSVNTIVHDHCINNIMHAGAGLRHIYT